jgi:hypothetical protein
MSTFSQTRVSETGPSITDTPLVVPPPPAPPTRYLSAIVDDSPCDGGHGRFCPTCASINRGIDRDQAMANHPAGKGRAL